MTPSRTPISEWLKAARLSQTNPDTGRPWSQEFLAERVSQWVVPVPLWVRLPTAALLVVWGARTDRAWVLPVAAGWAMPIPYPVIVATMLCAVSLGAAGRSRATTP